MGGLRSLWAELGQDRKLLTLALAMLGTYAYFVGPAAWNQNSRFALTRALVERGSTIIDAQAYGTGDKSFRDGHFYSDKAPGVSLLAAAPYAVFVGARRLTGGAMPNAKVEPLDPVDAAAGRRPRPEDRRPGDRLVFNPAHRVATYLCRLFSVTLVSLLGLAALHLLARRELRDWTKARAVVLAYGLGTPAMAYSCALYGHQACAAFLLLGFGLVALAPSDTGARPLGLAVGTCLGWAVLCEYPAAVPVLLITTWAVWRRGFELGVYVVAAGLVWALVLASYHTVAFGHPLSTGYDFVYLEEFAEGMRVRYGLSWPKPMVMLQLLFGRHRGLFYVAPVALLAAWGLVRSLASAPQRGEPGRLGRVDFACAAAIVAYYLLLNGGYYMWDGGASLGPRHMVPALPFLGLGFIEAVRRVPWATAVLTIVSAAIMAVVTAAGPETPGFGDPIWAYGVPELFQDRLDPGSATTLGNLLGLWGPLGLVPLVGMWIWLRPPGFGASDHRAQAVTDVADDRR